MEPYMLALQRQLDALADLRPRTRPEDEQTAAIHACALVSLEWGATFYWTPEFSSLLATTAPDLPLAWTLHPQSLPADYGFCWFGAPLALPEALRGVGHAGLPTVAVSWCALMEGEAGPIIPIHGVPPPRVGDAFATVYYVERDGRLLPHMVFPWRVGESLREALERAKGTFDPKAIGGFRMQANLFSRLSFFPAALAFMEQRIAVQTREPVDRATRRRIPASTPIEPVVRVIALRRRAESAPSDADARAVDWSCRWLVSGHWRAQFYPSENTHKTRWIEAYVKGPEGLPVKAPRARLFAVVR